MTGRERLARLDWQRLGTVATLGVGIAFAVAQAISQEASIARA